MQLKNLNFNQHYCLPNLITVYLVPIIMAGEQPLSQSEILQKLERVGNLESVVTEQRMRMEKLKTTYEMLKAEHIQLQEVCKLSNFLI